MKNLFVLLLLLWKLLLLVPAERAHRVSRDDTNGVLIAVTSEIIAVLTISAKIAVSTIIVITTLAILVLVLVVSVLIEIVVVPIAIVVVVIPSAIATEITSTTAVTAGVLILLIPHSDRVSLTLFLCCHVIFSDELCNDL